APVETATRSARLFKRLPSERRCGDLPSRACCLIADSPERSRRLQMSLPHRMKRHRALYALGAGVAAATALAIGVSTSPASTSSTRTAAASCSKAQGTLTYGISGAGISGLDPTTPAFSGQLPLQTRLHPR